MTKVNKAGLTADRIALLRSLPTWGEAEMDGEVWHKLDTREFRVTPAGADIVDDERFGDCSWVDFEDAYAAPQEDAE